MLLPLLLNLGSFTPAGRLAGRRPAPSFAIDPSGRLYIADAHQPVRSWDGEAADVRIAGVPAPTQPVTAESSGRGSISGTVYLFQRWIDVDGRVSNVSPVAPPHRITGGQGTITNATQDTPIRLSVSGDDLNDGDIIKVEGVQGNWGAIGTWVVAKNADGTVSLVGSVGTGLYTGGGTYYRGASQIRYASVQTPSDARVVRRQILRTKDGQANVAYVDIDTTDLARAEFTSEKTDDQLGAAVAFYGDDGLDLNLTRHAQPPNFHRSVMFHNGRMWLARGGVFTAGGVAVTKGRTTVTGLATDWYPTMVGRTLHVRGGASGIIASVTSQTELELVEAYTGETTAFAHYEISNGDQQRRTIYFSAPGLPESFDLNRALTVDEQRDAGELVGLFRFNSWLYILFENRIHRITYQSEPDLDGYVFPDTNRGCVNDRCYTVVEGTAYMLDRQGVYALGGSFTQDLGRPVQPCFDDGDLYAINWQRSELFHCVHDPRSETVRWFVCLSGTRYPRHALALAYRTNRWWVEEYPVPVTSSALGRVAGRHVVFLGSTGRRVYALAPSGSLDGVVSDGSTLRGTVTAATTISLTDSAALFPTSSADWTGAVVRIVSGRGAGQWRLIAEVTSATRLTVDRPWQVTPDTTSVYQVGGVSWEVRTGWFRWGQTHQNEKREVRLVFHPTVSAQRLEAHVYKGGYGAGRDDPVAWKLTHDEDGVSTVIGESAIAFDTRATLGDGKASGGVLKAVIDGHRAMRSDANRFVRVRLAGVTNAERLVLREIVLGGVAE